MATASLPSIDLDHALRRLAGRFSALVRVPDELMAALELPEEDALDLAAELEATSWISTWELDTGTFVVLTSLAAERLDIELQPPDTMDLRGAHWVPRGESVPPAPRQREHETALMTDVDPEGLGFGAIVDRKSVDPVAGAIAREMGLGRYPAHILGLDLALPWPRSWPKRGPVSCPGCHEQYQRRGSYCLICDREWRDGPNRRPINPEVLGWGPGRRIYRPDGALLGGMGSKTPGPLHGRRKGPR